MKLFISLIGLLTLWSTILNSGSINKVWVYPPETAKIQDIKTTAELRIDPQELNCMSKNIYFEAAVESTAGKLAVAQVTMNRVKSSSYPDTICGVVYEGKHHSNGFPVRDRCQFSWYCDGKGDEPRPTKAWRNSQDIAEYIIRTPSLLDITDGATHYHADWMKKYPKWAYQKKKLVEIDTHIFYKKRNNFNF